MLGSSNANIKAVITADDRASKAISNFGRNVNKTAKRAGIAIAAAGTAAVAFGVSAVKSFAESEDAIAQLNAVLKSTKGVAGVTSKAAIKLADSMQRVTKFSDEEILSAESLILTFTKINKKIFPDTVKIVADMSTALGQDLKSSSIQVGKALQDPILGVTALRRVGVNFSAAQKDVIKNLVDTGQSAKAQAIILKELQVEFGGSAKAAGETFSGKLAILKNSFDEVKESIGKVIIEALTPLFTKLATFVASDKFQLWLQKATDWLKNFLPQAINFISTQVIPILTSAFNTVWPVVKTLLKWLKDTIKFIADNTWIVKAFAGAFIAVKVAMGINGALGAAKNLVKFIKSPTAIGSWGILAAAAGGAAALIIDAANKARRAWENTAIAVIQASSSNDAVISRLRTLMKTGTPEQQKRAAATLKGLAEGGSFASGTNYAPGGLSLVGEKGPELVNLPRGSQVIPNDKSMKMGGSTINFNVNIGMFAGTQMERRKIAKMLFRDFQDVASQIGISPSALLDKSNGAIIR